ncbi:helix-turn-helix domain-containing protein [Rhizobium leguminosarum]
MHPIERIRVKVFKANQSEFAKIARVSQSTISKWENGAFEPSRDHLVNIRDEAIRRDLPLNDAWFFDRTGGIRPEAAA